ncbi:MAG TPA: type IV pilus assembly protein PilM [Fimbriimonadaceae bacterium]|nr:type IV pilus assembly protein PilM [Fimbriimonadaceae bacterium]
MRACVQYAGKSSMAKKINSAVGVDIGSQSIKVAEVKLQGGRPTVTAMAQAMTPAGAVDHIGIHDGEAVSAVLKEVCSMAGTSTGDMVVSIAGQGAVLVRTLEVPNMSESELEQHMDWEITRNIPFGEKTVQSDFKAFPAEDSAAQSIDVVMAISPQSAIEQVVSMVKKAGKKLAAIDVEPLGLARGLKLGYETDMMGKTVCVVDIGHKTSSINMYKDGQLLMPRQVPIGGEMFTQQIASAMNLQYDEAERQKIEQIDIPQNATAATGPFATGPETQTFEPYNPFGDTTEEEATPAAPPVPATPDAPVPAEPAPAANPMFNAIAATLDELVAEIKRSIEYFRSKGGDVDHILLCGGGSKMKGLPGFIEAAVGVDTQLYDPMRGLTQNIKPSDSVDEEHMEEFAVAVGNGLHICF